VVLQDPPHLWQAADCATATAAHFRAPSAAHHATCSADPSGEACRPIQLRRWLCELAGGLVSSEEGVVLPGPRKGVPQPGRWVRNIFGALRLQCWIRQLAGGLVHPEEGVVLLQQGQGLSPSSRRMRLSLCLMDGRNGGAGPRAIFQCHRRYALTHFRLP